MDRITQKHLEGLCNVLNTLTNNPLDPYVKNIKEYKQNVGNYHIDSAYGGVKLCQMLEHGTKDISTIGYAPKRELYEWIRAYISGIEIAHNR